MSGPPAEPDDYAIARRSLDEGDFAHALVHVGGGLGSVASAAAEERFFSLLDELVERCPHPEGFLAPRDSLYFGEALARAYLLARLGQHGRAVDLLSEVEAAQPGRPLFERGLAWLLEPGVVETVEPRAVLRYVQAWVARIVGLSDPDLAAELARRVVPLYERAQGGGRSDSQLDWCGVALLRRAGQIDRAREVAARAYEAAPGYLTAVARALVARQENHVEEAISFYRQALEHQGEDLSARLDIADLLLEAIRPTEAAQAYEEVLAREPGHLWALPSDAFACWIAGEGDSWRTTLAGLAAAEPPNERARALAARSRPPRAFEDYLPEPGEATVALIRKLPPDLSPGSELTLTLSHLESPSSRLAVRRCVEARGAKLVFLVSAVAKPDPRLPAAGVRVVLWGYEGVEPRPLVKPPEPKVADAVAEIARRPFARGDWLAASQEAAGRLGGHALESLVGIMVHPPPTPTEGQEHTWIYAVQAAAALVMAQLPDGWWHKPGSVLFDLARGPLDWSVEAALFGLTERALRNPGQRPAVEALFAEIVSRRPVGGFCCWEYALASNWLRLPGLPRSRRAHLEAWQSSLERE